MLQDLTVQLLNVSLMFSIGLALDPAEVRAALGRSRLLAAVVLVNFVVIPLIADLASRFLSLATSIHAGIVLTSVAPGGGTGTLLTRAARGNLELSVVALGLLTVLAVPLTPVLTLELLEGRSGVDVELRPMLRTLLLFQLLPLSRGSHPAPPESPLGQSCRSGGPAAIEPCLRGAGAGPGDHTRSSDFVSRSGGSRADVGSGPAIAWYSAGHSRQPARPRSDLVDHGRAQSVAGIAIVVHVL